MPRKTSKKSRKRKVCSNALKRSCRLRKNCTWKKSRGCRRKKRYSFTKNRLKVLQWHTCYKENQKNI